MTQTLAALIIDLLKADAGVAQIASTRVYPLEAEQGVTSPYVVMTEIITTTEESHDDAEGLDNTLMQFACYANTTLEAINLRKAVRTALLAAGAMDGVKVIQPVQRLQEADEDSLANAILELTFMHNPST